ncbi:MAG: TIGR03936 family radical SAM-associated protein [Coriobacteriia bacterium]|nr:TIGR03936 family radical SAM-associated protein [Coriobacteriia bacterium]MCL2749857.1 TIGR03936 family radical SAM-associated protein [Coriobacteriia bacterium]
MADFRLRIGFAKTGAAIWLSHLEVVRAMERCLRRSGLPCAISQGFSPHLKHSFSTALPVGTGSIGEFMDVELSQLVNAEQALEALQAAQHECLPILSAEYAPRDEPSLQVELNHSVYHIELDDPDGTVVTKLVKRLSARPEVTITKKGRPRVYELSNYIVDASLDSSNKHTVVLSLLSRPEGSLRPEVILEALASPDIELKIKAITRTALKHQDL